MSYASSRLVPGETIIYKAPVSKVAYANAIIALFAIQQFSSIFKVASTELALTDKRIIGKTGVFRKRTVALPHKDIEIVKVSQNPMGMLFGYGSVIISGKDGSRVKFRWIKHPHLFQVQANEAVELAVLGRRLADFDKPPPFEKVMEEKFTAPTAPILPPKPKTEQPQPRTAEEIDRAPVDPDQW